MKYLILKKSPYTKRVLTAIFFYFLLAVCKPGSIYAQGFPATEIGKLARAIRQAENDSVKILRIAHLAVFYNDYLDDHLRADSVSEQAIRIAEASHRPELLLLACNLYVESNDLRYNYQKALGYALRAGQIADMTNNPEIIFRTTKNIASVYLAGYQYDKALEYNYKSFSNANTSENVLQKAESFLETGRTLEGKNQKIEAFRNYITASSMAEKENNLELLKSCYDRLSNFYNFNKLYAKATRYKLMQRDLVRKTKPVDSVALMWTEYDLQVIDNSSNNNRLNETTMLNVLDFAARHGHQRLMNYEIALCRTYLIDANKIGVLHDLYYKRYPKEWDKLAASNPGLFFRLKAFFCEEQQKPDSALFFFRKAEQILASDPNMILQSKFYLRFGQFLLRHGDKNHALAKFNLSYEMAEKASWFEYMVMTSGLLESLYAETNDYRKAYKFAVLNKVLADSIDRLSKQDQILVMEIDHETRQRERLAEREHQETLRRHYLQYTAITIGILSAFVLLIMLGSLKVPEWIIRMLGFFSFIFLFEFIILLADHKIHEMTEGEPWKVLLIKIFLIAILLPLHHEIEKWVITYLLHHKLLDLNNLSIIRKFRNRGKTKREMKTQEDARPVKAQADKK
ncbi:MAG: hypothetical protein WCO44_13950 [Bacteroidota bacterium]